MEKLEIPDLPVKDMPRKCENHHHACDCREFAFAMITARMQWLHAQAKSLYKSIKHGAPEHQEWLKQALLKHFNLDEGDLSE